MGNKLKWIAPLGLGLILAVGGNVLWNHSQVNALENLSSSTYQTTPVKISAPQNNNVVAIQDSALSDALRTILGKSATDTFKSTDFINHEDFKAISTTDEESGVTTVTAKTRQLDLSGTGVKDIRELCQFQFPETLEGINLANNGITESNLDNIQALLNARNLVYDESTGTDIQGTLIVGDRTLDINSDFASIIKKVNLNDNNIDLSASNSYFSDTKLIFGIQKLNNIHESGLVLDNEINASYYIRESDYNYFSFIFKYDESIEEGSLINIKKDSVQTLIEDGNYGKYNFKIESIPLSDTAYFSGYTYNIDLTQFSAKIKDDYIVERGQLFDLGTINNKVTSDSKIEVKGLGSDFSVTYQNPSTNHITITTPGNEYFNSVKTTITDDNGAKRELDLEFIVDDTIAPVIKLKGASHMLSSKNKEFIDPGVIYFDPIIEGAEDGNDKDIHDLTLTTESTVKFTELGKYSITYTVTDLKGNKTTITRIVEIIEKALDRITLSTTTENIKEGDDVTLIVAPDAGTPIENYKDLTYYWYIGEKLFKTTSADTNGKGIITVIADSTMKGEITVKLLGKQKSNDMEVELYSNSLKLDIGASFRNDDTIILASAIAVIIIILIIAIITFAKYKKSKGKTHGKHKGFHKGKKADEKKETNSAIKVIKDYSGESGTSNYEPPKKDEPKTQETSEPTPPANNNNNTPPNPFDF